MFPRHLSTSEPDRLAWDWSSNVDMHQRDSSESWHQVTKEDDTDAWGVGGTVKRYTVQMHLSILSGLREKWLEGLKR